MPGSFLSPIHPLRLLEIFLQMGPGSALSLLLLGTVVTLYTAQSTRASTWIACVGLAAHTSILTLLGPSPQSYWLVAALLGGFLLFWIPLTPLYTKWSRYLSPVLSAAAGIWMISDATHLLAYGIAHQDTAKAINLWHAALLSLAVVFIIQTRLFQNKTFHRITWNYCGTAFLVAGFGGLHIGQWRGASSIGQAPYLYLTLFTAGLLLSNWWSQHNPNEKKDHKSSPNSEGYETSGQHTENTKTDDLLETSGQHTENAKTNDLLDRYQPYQGVAATHLFLILFAIATMYPVLWVVKMAATPQKGFSMGLNPLPPSLLNYLQASRQGDKKAASCYSRAMAQNFRELLGVGEACYDQVCQVYRVHRKRIFLQQQKKICTRFATAWKTEKKARPAALTAWRQALLKPMQTGPTRTLMSKLLLEVQYQQAKREKDGSLFWRYLLNSVLVAFITTLLGLLLACTAAYAFSRFRFPGRQVGLMSFLVSQMFPGTLMMIPLYILMSRLGLLDSLMGLSLVYSTTAIPFCVWMLKGYFDTIPKEIEEAALIDGASQTLIFWKIMVPLARPAIAVTALFSFMTAWNEFILAATFMNEEKSYTLPVMLYKFVGRHDTDWGHFAAGAIIVSLPIIFLFFTLQKNLVGGLTAGSVKG